MKRLAALLVLSLASAGSAAAQDADQDALDRTFEEMIGGARLEGQFNVVGPDGTSPGQVDLYSVSTLERGEGDTWIFRYTMSYGDNDIEQPIPVRVVWAGDTPILTMDTQTLEGLGTFTVRVMLFDGLYAGTWSSGTVGGHMWGRIVKDEVSNDG